MRRSPWIVTSELTKMKSAAGAARSAMGTPQPHSALGIVTAASFSGEGGRPRRVCMDMCLKTRCQVAQPLRRCSPWHFIIVFPLSFLPYSIHSWKQPGAIWSTLVLQQRALNIDQHQQVRNGKQGKPILPVTQPWHLRGLKPCTRSSVKRAFSDETTCCRCVINPMNKMSPLDNFCHVFVIC